VVLHYLHALSTDQPVEWSGVARLLKSGMVSREWLARANLSDWRPMGAGATIVAIGDSFLDEN
jgi:hypothetical protein